MVTKIVNNTDKDVVFYTVNIRNYTETDKGNVYPPVERIVKAGETLYSRSVTGDTALEDYLTKQGCTLSQIRRNLIVIVAGQSNAVGYDETPWDADDIGAIPYCYFDSQKSHGGYTGAEPIPMYNPGIDTYQDMQNVGSCGTRTKGIHYELAKRLIGLIPDEYELEIWGMAYGGSRLTGGNAGSVSGANLPENSTKWNSDGALSIATGKRLGIHLSRIQPESKLIGFVWCQGENDGSSNASVKEYEQAWKNTIDTIQTNAVQTLGTGMLSNLLFPDFEINMQSAFDRNSSPENNGAFVSFAGGEKFIVANGARKKMGNIFRTNLDPDQVEITWWGEILNDETPLSAMPYTQFEGTIAKTADTNTGFDADKVELFNTDGNVSVETRADGKLWIRALRTGSFNLGVRTKAAEGEESVEFAIDLSLAENSRGTPATLFECPTANITATVGVQKSFQIYCPSGYQGQVQVGSDSNSVSGSISKGSTTDNGTHGIVNINFTANKPGIYIARLWFSGDSSGLTAYFPIECHASAINGGPATFATSKEGCYGVDFTTREYWHITDPGINNGLIYMKIVNKLNGKYIGFVPVSNKNDSAVTAPSIEYKEVNAKVKFKNPMWFVFPGPQKYWNAQGTFKQIIDWQKENFTCFVDLPEDLPTNDANASGTKSKAWNGWRGYGFTSSNKASHYGQNAFRYIAEKVVDKMKQMMTIYQADRSF